MHVIHRLQIRLPGSVECYVNIVRFLSYFPFHDTDRLTVYNQRGDRISYDQRQGNDKNHAALDLFSHTLFHIITCSYGIRLRGPSQSVRLHLQASVLKF